MHKIFRKKSEAGFTLVEIMVVIAVIGLIAAIAIPNFLKVRDMAAANTCIANLKRIDDAKAFWALDRGMLAGDNPAWSDLVPDYIKRSPTCPAGGTYTINNVNTRPTCSIADHELL